MVEHHLLGAEEQLQATFAQMEILLTVVVAAAGETRLPWSAVEEAIVEGIAYVFSILHKQ
jgi:hypothetical protein